VATTARQGIAIHQADMALVSLHVKINVSLILFGGTNGDGYFRDVWRLHLFGPTSDSKHLNGFPYWEQMCSPEDINSFEYYRRRRNLPDPVYKHGACLKNEILYVIGGGQHVDSSTPFPNIFAADLDAIEYIPSFCLTSKEWSLTQTFPDPRKVRDDINILHGYPNRRMSMAWTVSADNKHFYMVGGVQVQRTRTNAHFAKRRPLNDVWKLEIDKLQWHYLGTVPDYEEHRLRTWGLTFHSCALSLSETHLYISGGYKVFFVEDPKNRYSTRRHNESLLRVTLRIPTLAELAKDTLRRVSVNPWKKSLTLSNISVASRVTA